MSTAKTRTACATYSFTLVFAGEYHDLSEEVVDAIFEVGCDDSHISICEGVLRIDFDREAPSYRIALTSAIADIERAGVGLELIRVEHE
ncbi:MAG TPA: hypothetical protein VG406_05935 [Isosphaeraceae bacterium]|jgi:hypothetical protein|nr:hypothetical protein [Isosphaeraceae bacterium]